MSSIVVAGDTSGSITLQAPGVAGSAVLTLPTVSGTVVATDSAGNVGIGTVSPTAKLQVNGGTAQYSPSIAVRTGVNQYEWGHTNTAGYGSVIGVESGSGMPFIGFSCGGGTTSNTYRTYGLVGSVISSDNAGGVLFRTVVAANADNQTPIERMRITSAGNVGIGTINPNYLFNAGPTNEVTSLAGVGLTLFASGSLTSSNGGVLNFRPSLGTTASNIYNLSICAYDHGGDTNADGLSINGYDGVSFCTGSNSRQERMRIDSSGNLLVGTTTTPGQNTPGILIASASSQSYQRISHGTRVTAAEYFYFYNGNGQVGSISSSGSTTSYTTSSDYRLKDTITPMTGALAKVALLKPATYKWKVDGSDGQGFIAHELQAVVPNCVTGEKDAVDAEGNPQYQGVDTSFLVATLTAAIQELKAIIDTQNARIESLEAK